MLNGKGMMGKPIVAYDSGEQFKNIVDLIFDQESNLLLGFLVDEGGWFSNALVLPLGSVQAIGVDAVIVASRSAIVPASEFPQIQRILERDNILKGTRIMTLDGRDLGTMEDLYFDEMNGLIEGYEVSGGIFADAYSGRSFVPAPDTLKIGEDIAFVPSETADLMEEQVGGIKAALQTAGEKVQEIAHTSGEKAQEAAQLTGAKLQELAQISGEKAQEAAQLTGSKLQELAQISGEKAQEAAELTGSKLQEVGQLASTNFTNAVVTPEEQEEFVLGKIAQRTIDIPNGGYLIQKGQVVQQTHLLVAQDQGLLDELYHATGGSARNTLGERFTGAVAGIGANIGVEQARGRRVKYMVFTPEGSVVAVEGQIVTPQVIARAKTHHQEHALLEAVGLTTGDSLKTSLRTTSSDVGHQVKAGAEGLWEQVKETASNLQEQGTQAIEDRRIKGALGRPVTRVILDRNDEVILNVGELITHQAIDISRQSDVLDVLLDSVYTATPNLSLDELRAPEPGRASLTQGL